MKPLTYLKSLADLCPLRRVLIARTLGHASRGKRVIHLFERAFEVQHVFGVALEYFRLYKAELILGWSGK